MLRPDELPRVGQAFEELPPQLNASQVQAWLGLSRHQWDRVRRNRKIRAAMVFGAVGDRRMRYWTVKLADLVPPGADTEAAAQRRNAETATAVA